MKEGVATTDGKADSTAKTIESKNDNTYTVTYNESKDRFWVPSVEENSGKTENFSGTYVIDNNGAAITLNSPNYVASIATKWVGAIGAELKDVIAEAVQKTPQVTALSSLFSNNQAQVITALSAIARSLKAEGLKKVPSFEALIAGLNMVLAKGWVAIIKALKANAQNNLRILKKEMLKAGVSDGGETYNVQINGNSLVLNSTQNRFVIFDTSVNNIGKKNEKFTFTKK